MLGQQDKMKLGNIDSKRDWGYAPEYVEGMWRILQADKPDDFVLATNETHSIREFIEETFSVFGEKIIWSGKGVNEKGILKSSGKEVVSIDPKYFRPTEVDILIGDPAKAARVLGWKPKTTFKDLVKIMVDSDFEKAKRRAE
jgi:GDPmannose 4,6-dehydratase